MTDWSITGEVFCSPDTICGNLPKYTCICGKSVCSPFTICGYGQPVDDTVSTPENRKVNALLKIFKSNGAIHQLSLVSCSIRITNPCDNDEARVECIDRETLDIGDRVHIYIGYPTKYLAFVGDIVSITRDETGITQATVESIVDRLKYRYLKGDISFSGVTRASAITNILRENVPDLNYALDIKPDATFRLTKEYWAWDKTILDIIKDIMWDHNIYFTYKTLRIENPDTEVDLVLDYTRSKFESWTVTREQGDQYYLIHVDGSDCSADKHCYNSGTKEFSYNDMTLTTADEVDRVANILATEMNKALYNVQVKLPYLIPPYVGKVRVKLPGLDEKLIIKEIEYEVSGTSLSTTLTLGSHRKPLSFIMNKIISQIGRSHFVW